MLSHHLGISFFGTAALIFFFLVRLYLGGYRDQKEKILNEISPRVLGLVKAWKCGFTGIGPISSTPCCLYVGPYSGTTPGLRLYTYTFLNQKFRSVGLGFSDNILFCHISWSRHIVDGSNLLCFRVESFFFKYVFSIVCSCL